MLENALAPPAATSSPGLGLTCHPASSALAAAIVRSATVTASVRSDIIASRASPATRPTGMPVTLRRHTFHAVSPRSPRMLRTDTS